MNSLRDKITLEKADFNIVNSNVVFIYRVTRIFDRVHVDLG